MTARTSIVAIVSSCVAIVSGYLLLKVFAKEYRERKFARQIATRDTLSRISAIGEALERVSATEGRFPCIRTRADFPKAAEALLPRSAFVDAWGGAIKVRSSSRRYVIVSFGSDRRLDDRYDLKNFSGTAGDIIYSDGDWLHVSNEIVTLIDLVPKPADAFAEASDCEKAFQSPWGASRLASLYIPGRDPELGACENHLYFRTERQARATAIDAAHVGFSTEVRTAVGGDWLLVARKIPGVCHDADFALWKIGKRHGLLR